MLICLSSEASGMKHYTNETCTTVHARSDKSVFPILFKNRWTQFTLSRKTSPRLLSATRSKICDVNGLYQCPWQLIYTSLIVNQEQHVQRSKQDITTPQQDHAKPVSAHITKAWLQKLLVKVLHWPACSPNIWRILKWKM